MMTWREELKKRAERGHLLRVSEIAKLLGVTRQHIYNMINAGELPGVYRLSIRGIRVCAATLLEWSQQKLWVNQILGGRSEAIDLGTAVDADSNDVESKNSITRLSL